MLDRDSHRLSVGGVAKDVLLHRLHESGVRLNELALSLFADARFTTAPAPTTVEVTLVSVAALGFPAGAGISQLVERAEANGLNLCPLELGPHFRLSFLEQHEDLTQSATRGCAPPGSITAVSAPLDDQDETPKGFYLRRIDGTLWLRGYRSWVGHVWSPQDVLAFVRGT